MCHCKNADQHALTNVPQNWHKHKSSAAVCVVTDTIVSLDVAAVVCVDGEDALSLVNRIMMSSN